jgi:hypothetical protein
MVICVRMGCQAELDSRFKYSHDADRRCVARPETKVHLVAPLDLLIQVRRTPESSRQDYVGDLLIRR